MNIIVIRPWQARLLLGLAFAVFVAGGYHVSQQAAVSVAGGPPPLDAPLFEVPGVAGMVTLAVNVDWGEEEIPRMLDVFDRHGVKVTFFLTGRWAEKNAALARTMAERGHEIGNHGRSHAHPKQLDEKSLADHIAGNEAVLNRIVGQTSRLYAPPYGEWDRRIVESAARLGYRTVLWTLDTIDWQNPSPARIIERVVPKAKSGSIILMHPRPNTVAALPLLLTGLHEKGLQVVTLTAMLSAAGGGPAPL